MSEDLALMTQWEALVGLLQSVETDLKKAQGGNAAAARRVRKVLREAKAGTADLAKAILEHSRK